MTDEAAKAEEERRRARGDFMDEDETNDEVDDELEEEIDEDESDDDSADSDDDDSDDSDDDDSADSDDDDSDDDDSDDDDSDDDDSDDDDSDDSDDSDDKASRGKGFVPRYRLDSKAKRVRELEEENARLRRERAKEEDVKRDKDLPPPEERLVAIQSEYDEAISTGNVEKAKELRAQERKIEREIAQQDALIVARQEVEAERYSQFVANLEETYPAFDRDSEEYNQELVEEVTRWTRRGVADGASAVVALQEAVDLVYPKYFPEEKKAPKTPSEKADKGKKVAADRKKAAVDRAVDTSKRQPVSAGRRGSDSDSRGVREKVDPNRLSTEEYMALPESKRKALRGDMG